MQEQMQMQMERPAVTDAAKGSEVTDAALATAWAAGDERAFEAIVTRYSPLIYARCRRALTAADADDATQAVFLVLARRGAQAAARPVLLAWLYEVTGFVIRNARRDRGRRQRAERSLPPRLSVAPPTEPEDAMSGLTDHLDACLEQLPVREREPVLLHHLAGHSLAQVAQQTGTPTSTVKHRLARGLQRLRALLARRGVTVGALALLAALHAEARAEVPPDLVVHLQRLASARSPGAPTAPTGRILAWSRSRRLTMTRIAIAGAAALLIGGMLFTRHGTLAAATAGDSPSGSAPVTTAVPAEDLRTRHWRICLPDPAATSSRLLAMPEAALLPAEPRSLIAALVGAGTSGFTCDGIGDILSDPVTGNYRFSPLLGDPGLSFRQRILQPMIGWLAGKGWRIEEDASGPAPTSSLPPLPAGDDVYLAQYTTGPSANPEMLMYAGVDIARQALRMTFKLDHSSAKYEYLQGTIDPACFQRVPGSALLAIGLSPHFLIGLSRGQLLSSADSTPRGASGSEPGAKGDLVPGPQDSFQQRYLGALEKTEGDILIWWEEGPGRQFVHIEMQVAEDAVAGLGIAIDTVENSRQAGGKAGFHARLIDGRWHITNDPSPIPEARATGLFTRDPEVAASLAAMPTTGSWMRVVVRTGAVLDYALPFLGTIVSPEAIARIRNYRDDLRSRPVPTWLMGGRSGEREQRIEANGLAAIAVGIAGMNMAANPEQLLKIAN